MGKYKKREARKKKVLKSETAVGPGIVRSGNCRFT